MSRLSSSPQRKRHSRHSRRSCSTWAVCSRPSMPNRPLASLGQRLAKAAYRLTKYGLAGRHPPVPRRQRAAPRWRQGASHRHRSWWRPGERVGNQRQHSASARKRPCMSSRRAAAPTSWDGQAAAQGDSAAPARRISGSSPDAALGLLRSVDDQRGRDRGFSCCDIDHGSRKLWREAFAVASTSTGSSASAVTASPRRIVSRSMRSSRLARWSDQHGAVRAGPRKRLVIRGQVVEPQLIERGRGRALRDSDW